MARTEDVITEPKFKPFALVIENEDEARHLYHLLNVPIDVAIAYYESEGEFPNSNDGNKIADWLSKNQAIYDIYQAYFTKYAKLKLPSL